MIIPKALSRVFIILVSMSCLAMPGTTAAVMPEDVPPILDDLSNRVATLEGLVRRLHGNKIAVLTAGGGTHFEAGDKVAQTTVQAVVTFCPTPSCKKPFPEGSIVLESPLLTEADVMSVIRFDATDPDFQGIVDLLTNDRNDSLNLEANTCAPSLLCGGGSHSYTEFSAFFLKNPWSSGAAYVDLKDAEIGSISIVPTLIDIQYNGGTNQTETRFDYQVLFELAN